MDLNLGSESLTQCHNMSPNINGIIWSRQLGGKVKKILSVIKLLKDLNGFEEFKVKMNKKMFKKTKN